MQDAGRESQKPDVVSGAVALESKPKLLALEALRGFAALLVVADHSIAIRLEKTGQIDAPLLAFGYALGTLGVATFFIISGFVMIHAHGHEFGNRSAPGRFFDKRISRIVPLYWFMTSAYAVNLILTSRSPSLGEFIKSLLFIPYQPAGDPFGHPVLGQGWTLNYEAFFYLIFGLCLFARNGLPLVFAFFVLTISCGLTGLFPENTIQDFLASPICGYFLLGILFGMGRKAVGVRINFYQGIIGVAVLFATSSVAIFYHPDLEYFIVPLCAFLTAGTCIFCSDENIDLASAFVSKKMGAITYAVYLTHTLLIAQFAKRFTSIPFVLFCIAMVPVCIIGGYIVQMYIEKPLIGGWKSMVRRKRLPAS